MNRFKEISAELTRRGDLLREKYPKRSSMDLIGELFMSCKTDDERHVCLQLKHRHVKEFQNVQYQSD
ncbi:hypothetical protein SCCGRSA3_02608 [Marine Group I thaumarchaeote SCGC RSA3]|uniref:Uncharacterized protein n=1 Tax=Marine Group I thaumarchaeote SCGC RSA3 TaxID=1503183 RepID=A0A087RQF6_9ARCH|nr:hypothetical protein SCCGRSA3_02608 [Marine Group I thaumarchaeote SCGC RSA3]